MKLTPRQNEVYQVICQKWSQNGSPPTYDEIAQEFGWHVNAAREHVIAIRKKGYLEPVEVGKSRGVIPLGLKAHIAKFFYGSCKSF